METKVSETCACKKTGNNEVVSIKPSSIVKLKPLPHSYFNPRLAKCNTILRITILIESNPTSGYFAWIYFIRILTSLLVLNDISIKILYIDGHINDYY